jgi:hypothetical protein
MKRIVIALLLTATLGSTAASADPIKLGGSYFAQNCGSGTTIVSAAANVAGITISSGTLTASPSVQTSLNAVYPDGTTHTLWMAYAGAQTSSNIPYPIFIPAGIALTCIPSTSGAGGAFITYNLFAN